MLSIFIHTFLSLSLIQISLSSNDLGTSDYFPNIGYLGTSYNVITGNPSSTARDLGIGKQVFDFEYKDSLTTDHRYKIPEGTQVLNAESCSIEFDSTEVTKSSEYQKEVGTHISGDVGFEIIKFTGSLEFKDIVKATKNYENTITISEAVCTTYSASILRFDPPKLTRNFIGWVKYGLPDRTMSKAKLREFVDNFGTHVITELLMGARYSEISEINTESWTDFKSKTDSWKLALKLSAMVTFGIDVGSDDKQELSKKFKKITKSQRQLTIGSRPPKEGGAKEWSQMVFKNPMPVHYKVQRLDKFITSRYFQESGMDPQLLERKRMMLSMYLDGICADMVQQGKLKSCDSQDQGQTQESCRLCMSCRKDGEFSIETGKHLIQNDQGKQDPRAQWNVYGHYCYGQLREETEEDWSLCCTAPKPECAFCQTCGGEYQFETGRHAWWHPSYYKDQYKVKHDHCSGSLGTYSGVWRTCCRHQSLKACRLCEVCGKEMEEVGGRYGQAGELDPLGPFGSSSQPSVTGTVPMR